MTKDEFKEFVVTSTEYFGLKNVVDSSRFDLWFREVSHIPAESLPYIKSMLFSEKESMPRNIPKFVKEFYSQWLNANPDKVAHRNKASICHECGSTGFLFFRKADGYKYVARCSSCRNWTREINPGSTAAGVPGSMSRASIQDQMWTLF